MDLEDASSLEAARSMLGLTVRELWVDYMRLGGNLSLPAITAALSGRGGLREHDHDVLVQALNEVFLDRGEDHPLSYADELTGPRGRL